MKTEQEFQDLFVDRDGDYAMARFLTLALSLVKQGRRPDRVYKAMLRAAYDASIQHSVSEHRDFVIFAANDSAEWLRRVEEFCDGMLSPTKN